MKLAVFLFCFLLAAREVPAQINSNLSVTLPPGETSLADIGLYRVGWQSYGQPAAWMPLSWTGHFDPDYGISYAKWGQVLGREALLMHSPWHVRPGRTWVDYQLALPAGKPVRLSFGIAMGPDVAVPDKSDGVTFSCYLTIDGQERELMRQHQDKAEWKDYAFDLSPYAGKTVTLRLQVEPGPKNNASWDYSFFGNPSLAIGSGKEMPAKLAQRLASLRSYQATEKANRSALSNTSKNGVTPSNLLPATNSLAADGKSWRFTYAGEDCRVAYVYTPATGTLDDFTAQVDNGREFQPAVGGGATASVPQPGSSSAKEIPVRHGQPLEIHASGNILRVLWQYDVQGRPLKMDWSYQILGKSLLVTVRCDDPIISRFSLGDVVAPLRRTIPVPYLQGYLNYLPDQNLFACRYIDWTQSQASSCPQGMATYDLKTDGQRNTLFETGYIAVSPDVGEVLPNIPHPPSPHLATLGPRIMLDIWGHHEGYAGDAAKLRELKDNGIDHVAIIQHDWQRYGYDVKLPDHLPANPAYGPESSMIAFGKAANESGYIWSLHENYIDLYTDAPSYDPAARVLLADGSPSKAWYNPGTKMQSFGLKCNRALGFAKQNSPEAHLRYDTTAAYLDVHTCVPPWHQLDHEASQPMAAMARAKVKSDTQLFQFERDTHRGPLFGEGANHFYWAGLCDGVEAQVSGGEDHSPFLDFDLLKIHPQMVNHGMGYYERWYRRGEKIEYGQDAGSIEQWDKYRAMELAYGHAGFLSYQLVHNVQAVAREHHLMHPVQKLYGTAKPVEISYEVEGKLVNSSIALVAGETSRQRIRYDSGLTLWVNWRNEPWTISPHQGRSPQILPQWGFLAVGPNTEASTAFYNGKVADYVDCPEYVFADARTWFDLPYRQGDFSIEPRLRDFKYLGGNRAQATYEWIVNDTLETDYLCFVHGINEAEPGADQIAFQGDHPLPKPTRQWQRGEVIVDGPHELKISAEHDHYDLVTGLYRGNRLRLKGPKAGGNRILIAHLKIQKQGGEITSITAEKPTRTSAANLVGIKKADFEAHTNPSGTWIEFGKVATDGAVKINRKENELLLFPYPRESKFSVSLDVKALAPALDPGHLQVHALAAGAEKDLGPVDFKIKNGRLTLVLGAPGAGRYRIFDSK